MNNCDHKREYDVWVEEEHPWDGSDTSHWTTHTEYTTVDLDTHRYKCLQCNKVMYYSSAAQEYYTTGVDRKGLFQ